MSLGNKICRFFKKLGKLPEMVAPSSAFQARKKIKSELYRRLTTDTVQMYYQKGKKYVKRWRNRLLWAVDSTSINLPDSEETRAFYSKATNQTSVTRIQGLGNFLYDVLNEVVLNAVLTEKISEVDVTLDEQVQHYTDEAIVIYDRGFVSYLLISTHALLSKDFVLRVPLSETFPKVCEFVKSNDHEQIVEIEVSWDQKKIVREKKLPEKVKVRLIKIILSTGETEILMTSLLDQQLYPFDDFKWLYHQRWKIESYFARLKDLLDVQRFSSGFDLEIQQDFHAIIFLSTLESVITKEDEKSMQEKTLNKHQHKINKAISYAEVADSIVELLLDKRPIEEIFKDIHYIVKMTPTVIRPDRSFPREKKRLSHKLHFQKYKKKIFT